MKGIRKIILLLAAVALVLACIATAFTREVLVMLEAAKPDVSEQVVIDVPSDSLLEDTEEFCETVEDPDDEAPNCVYTEKELEILAIIIYQEAGADYCSDDTRRKVGSVFLNRVNHSGFPDTFEEVATGKSQYGTLYWTGIVWPDRAVNPGEAHAVERAYRIAEELLLSGSILPPNVIWQAEFPQGDGLYCQQDNIYFCYSEVSK